MYYNYVPFYDGMKPVANTEDDYLFQTMQYDNIGMFSYEFDVPNYLYDVTLHFAEMAQYPR